DQLDCVSAVALLHDVVAIELRLDVGSRGSRPEEAVNGNSEAPLKPLDRSDVSAVERTGLRTVDDVLDDSRELRLLSDTHAQRNAPRSVGLVRGRLELTVVVRSNDRHAIAVPVRTRALVTPDTSAVARIASNTRLRRVSANHIAVIADCVADTDINVINLRAGSTESPEPEIAFSSFVKGDDLSPAREGLVVQRDGPSMTNGPAVLPADKSDRLGRAERRRHTPGDEHRTPECVGEVRTEPVAVVRPAGAVLVADLRESRRGYRSPRLRWCQGTHPPLHLRRHPRSRGRCRNRVSDRHRRARPRPVGTRSPASQRPRRGRLLRMRDRVGRRAWRSRSCSSPSLPELSVARKALNHRLRKKRLVSVVDCVMCSMRGRDEELRIENIVSPELNVLDRHRVEVMDVDPIVDLMALDSEIAPIVSDDDRAADVLPLTRSIEPLV